MTRIDLWTHFGKPALYTFGVLVGAAAFVLLAASSPSVIEQFLTAFVWTFGVMWGIVLFVITVNIIAKLEGVYNRWRAKRIVKRDLKENYPHEHVDSGC